MPNTVARLDPHLDAKIHEALRLLVTDLDGAKSSEIKLSFEGVTTYEEHDARSII